MKTAKGLSEKEFLGLMSSKLKLVLNPTIYNKSIDLYSESTDSSDSDDLEYKTYFILQTDITKSGAEVGFFIDGAGQDQNDNPGIVKFNGYFTYSNSSYLTLYGLNNGTIIVDKFGFRTVSGNLFIFIRTNGKVNSLSAEVFKFNGEDNKNHCSTIELAEDLDESRWITGTFSGESALNFSFKVVDADNQDIIVNKESSSESTVIDSIKTAGTSDKLSRDIPIVVTYSDDSELYDKGTIPTSETSGSASLILPTPANISIPGPTSTDRGGIRLVGSRQLPSNCYPLKVTSNQPLVSDNDVAYVDLSNLSMSIQTDIHRYDSMATATEKCTLGNIVQYIGPTNSEYIFGYYYLLTKVELSGILPAGSWYGIGADWQTTLNQGLTSLYAESDYLLSISDGLTISLADESDSSSDSDDGELLFDLTSGGYTIRMTYDQIKAQFGILLYSGVSNYTVTIALAYNTQETTWVLKNVLPPVKMQSALIYKGVIAHYDDLPTSTAQSGDFYSVTDRNNQEYFFSSSGEWEYMGEVFTLILSDWNESDSTKSSFILHKPEIPTIVQANWDESDSDDDSFILNKPNLATVATSGSYADLTNTPTIPTLVLADWDESDSDDDSYICNKPIIRTETLDEINLNETSGSSYSTELSCASAKYNIIHFNDSSEGLGAILYINTSASVPGGYMPREIICRLDAPNTTHDITITKSSGDTGSLEPYVNIETIEETPTELVFTFWKDGLVSYNGGNMIS